MHCWRFTLSELSLKFPQRAETLFGIPFTHVDNALGFRLPANNVDIPPSPVLKPAVKQVHTVSPTVGPALLWLHGASLPDTMTSYQNGGNPCDEVPRCCGTRLFTVKLFMRWFSPYQMTPRRPELHTRGRHPFLDGSKPGKAAMRVPAS